MKKLIILFAALLAAATLTGCTADDPEIAGAIYSYCNEGCYNYCQTTAGVDMTGSIDGSWVEDSIIYYADGTIYQP